MGELMWDHEKSGSATSTRIGFIRYFCQSEEKNCFQDDLGPNYWRMKTALPSRLIIAFAALFVFASSVATAAPTRKPTGPGPIVTPKGPVSPC